MSDPRRRLPLRLAAAVLACAAAGSAAAFPFGSATCEANADGSFMSNGRLHHPGQSGGFVLRFDRPSFYAGETLQLTLSHEAGEVFKGFLLYARTAAARRDGLFQPAPGTTFVGALPEECAHIGHTITHNNQTAPDPIRSVQRLAWTAPGPDLPREDLVFHGLVLRADPISEAATDFYELRVALPYAADGVFRASFDAP
jgi:hypothetical protein